MLQNRVTYATGLHRAGICVPQSRVYMPQLSCMHATKQVTYATGLHRSLGRVHMLQNRVAYATGLYRIGICMSLSRVLYATV